MGELGSAALRTYEKALLLERQVGTPPTDFSF